MVASMGLLWLMPWNCYNCSHEIAMIATMAMAIIERSDNNGDGGDDSNNDSYNDNYNRAKW